jgi:hypothetical protein
MQQAATSGRCQRPLTNSNIILSLIFRWLRRRQAPLDDIDHAATKPFHMMYGS